MPRRTFRAIALAALFCQFASSHRGHDVVKDCGTPEPAWDRDYADDEEAEIAMFGKSVRYVRL